MPPPYLEPGLQQGQPGLQQGLEQGLGHPLEDGLGDRLGDGYDEERVVEIVPLSRRTPVRVVGPGKRERAYLEMLARLQSDLGANEVARRGLARALETATLIERGSTRVLDRLEREIEDGEGRRRELEQQEHRLILALGALQRENEILRVKLALRAAKAPSRALPERRSFLFRLFGRA